jgi:hypothetical protein
MPAASPADDACMDVVTAAAFQVQVMQLDGVRAPLEQIQANPVPADAPQSAHADVVLELSSAAQRLMTL